MGTTFPNLQKMTQGVPPPQIFCGQRGTVWGNNMETECGLTVAYSQSNVIKLAGNIFLHFKRALIFI